MDRKIEEWDKGNAHFEKWERIVGGMRQVCILASLIAPEMGDWTPDQEKSNSRCAEWRNEE
jgi:hypothetical protein